MPDIKEKSDKHQLSFPTSPLHVVEFLEALFQIKLDKCASNLDGKTSISHHQQLLDSYVQSVQSARRFPVDAEGASFMLRRQKTQCAMFPASTAVDKCWRESGEIRMCARAHLEVMNADEYPALTGLSQSC